MTGPPATPSTACLRIGIRLAALATIVLPSVSWAQRPMLPDSLFVPSCDAGHTMPMDTAEVTFVARPGIDDEGEQVRGRSYKRARAVTKILRQYFSPPDAAALPQPHTGYRGADLKVWLDWNGRMTGVEWNVASRSPVLTNAVLRALRAADSALAFVKLRKPLNVPIRLSLAAVDKPADDDQPLMPLQVAYYPVEQPVQVLEMPAPRYPRELQGTAVNARVELQYLVDTGGRAIPTTLWVVSATDDRFIAAASEAVLRGTFRPAQGHGCRLGMIVQQAVSFKVAPGYDTFPAGNGRTPPDTGLQWGVEKNNWIIPPRR